MFLHSWSFLSAVFSTIVIVETSATNYYAQTTGLTTWKPMITSSPDLSNCKACAYSYRVANFWWDDAIYNQTTAAVEIIIDDSINKTSTSTLKNASYTMPPLPDGARDVVGSVATLALDPSTYYLTYPTRYPIHWGYLATFRTTTTLSENGTSRVVCTERQVAYTEAFASDKSGSTTAGDLLDAFTASNFKGCFANHPVTALYPSTKVRVSAVTVTSTRHTSHGKLPMISTPTTTTERVKPTAYSNTADAIISEPITTFPIYFSGPLVHSSLTGSLGPKPTPTEHSSKPTGDATFSMQHPTVTSSLKTDQIEPASRSQGIFTPPGRITVGSETFTADASSEFVIGTKTLEAGGPAITHNGHTLSLGSSASNIIIDSSTVSISRLPVIAFIPENAPVLIGSQTLTPGGPAITVSGTMVSLDPSASNLVVGTSTEPLGSIIMDGFGPTSSGEAKSTITEPVAFTGGLGLGKRPCIWAAVVMVVVVVGLVRL